ncbi:hypothetical protein N7578_20930, partial [Agrobacterium tumefaciens]|nr:hypothetical protein [Agrobacterium tumefaciens]
MLDAHQPRIWQTSGRLPPKLALCQQRVWRTCRTTTGTWRTSRRACLKVRLKQATVEEDFGEKIRKLKAQFNPANTELAIRELIFLARNNADEQAKRRLMPIVRQFIQKVVIGKPPGHQLACLGVPGRIASILAAMQAATILEKQF